MIKAQAISPEQLGHRTPVAQRIPVFPCPRPTWMYVVLFGGDLQAPGAARVHDFPIGLRLTIAPGRGEAERRAA